MPENNPFGDLVPQQQPPGSAFGDLVPTAQTPPSSFMDGVEAFNRSFGRMAEGTLSKFAEFTGLTRATQAIDTVNKQEEQSLSEAKIRSPIATMAGGITGDVASSIAYGAVGAAAGSGIGMAASKVPAVAQIGSDIVSGAQAIPKVVRGMAGLAGASGALGYLNYADSEEKRIANATNSALVGGALYGVGSAVNAGIKAVAPKEGVSGFLTKVLNPKQAATQDLAHRVNVDEIATGQPGLLSQAAKSAERQGVPVTPGQLMQHEQLRGGGNTRNAEMAMRVAEADKPLVAAVSNEQLSKVSAGVKKSLDDLVPGGLEKAVATKNQLYSELDTELFATPSESSNKVIDLIKGNSILSSHLDDINTSSLKSLPDNSFVKVDALKKTIDDKLWNDSNPFMDPAKKMPHYERADLMQARDDLLGTLKAYDNNPKYVQARQLSQQITTQEKYLDVLNKKTGNQTLEDTYSALFNSKKKQEVFLKDVESVGGNVQDVKDFMNLSGMLSKSPLVKKIGEQSLDSPDIMIKGRSEGIVQSIVNKVFLSRYDKAYLDLTLGGARTRDAIKSILAPKTADGKISAFLQVLKEQSVAGTERAGAVAGGGYLQ